MNGKYFSSFLLIPISFFYCCKPTTTPIKNVFEKSVSQNIVEINKNFIAPDTLLYQNYLATLNNFSTIRYFIVIKVKNVNTGEIREVCTKSNFLEEAIAEENKCNYDSSGMAAINQVAVGNFKRYFEFKGKLALNNIGYDDYSIAELNKLASEINFDSLATEIKKTKSWSKELDDKKMKMYAHELFDRGILTAENNCFGG